jgi:hypothetical protein
VFLRVSHSRKGELVERLCNTHTLFQKEKSILPCRPPRPPKKLGARFATKNRSDIFLPTHFPLFSEASTRNDAAAIARGSVGALSNMCAGLAVLLGPPSVVLVSYVTWNAGHSLSHVCASETSVLATGGGVLAAASVYAAQRIVLFPLVDQGGSLSLAKVASTLGEPLKIRSWYVLTT